MNLPNFRSSFDPHFFTSSLALRMKWTRRPRPSPTRLISRRVCPANKHTNLPALPPCQSSKTTILNWTSHSVYNSWRHQRWYDGWSCLVYNSWWHQRWYDGWSCLVYNSWWHQRWYDGWLCLVYNSWRHQRWDDGWSCLVYNSWRHQRWYDGWSCLVYNSCLQQLTTPAVRWWLVVLSLQQLFTTVDDTSGEMMVGCA